MSSSLPAMETHDEHNVRDEGLIVRPVAVVEAASDPAVTPSSVPHDVAADTHTHTLLHAHAATPEINTSDPAADSRSGSPRPRAETASPNDGPRIITRVRVRFAGGVQHINDYRFCACVGAGVFAEVILAQDERNGGYVAVKCFSKSKLQRKREVKRVNGRTIVKTALDKVQSEIQTHMLLRAFTRTPTDAQAPTHILALREVLSDPAADEIYFVMDFADAGPVMTYAPEDSAFKCTLTGAALPLQVIKVLAHDLFTALKCAHGLGVAHRDIKPENLLMNKDGMLRIADWGASTRFGLRPRHARTTTGTASAETAVSGDTQQSPRSSLEQTSEVDDDATDDDYEEDDDEETDDALEPGVEPIDRIAVSGVADASARSDDSAEQRHVVAALAPSAGSDTSATTPGEHGVRRIPSKRGRPHGWVTDTAGTYLFLPPEACTAGMGGHDAFAADMWAAGVSIYIMAFACVPFGRHADNPMALFESIQRDRLIFPYGNAHDAAAVSGDHDFHDLLYSLLERDVQKRLTAEQALAHPFFVRSDLPTRVPFPPIDISALPPFSNPGLALMMELRAKSDAAARRAVSAVGSAESGEEPSAPVAASVGDAALGPSAESLFGKAGWLWKRGRIVRSWRKRYFRIVDRELRYFAAASATAKQAPAVEPPTGSTGPSDSRARSGSVLASWRTKLLGRRAADSAASVAAKQPGGALDETAGTVQNGAMPLQDFKSINVKTEAAFEFVVETASRTLLLRAESAESMRDWIAAITAAAGHRPSGE